MSKITKVSVDGVLYDIDYNIASYATIADMLAEPIVNLKDGMLAYVLATDKYYKWLATNTVITDLARWRECEFGSDFQKLVMPAATADNEGKVYQYIGATDTVNNFTHGYFYENLLMHNVDVYTIASVSASTAGTYYIKIADGSYQQVTLDGTNYDPSLVYYTYTVEDKYMWQELISTGGGSVIDDDVVVEDKAWSSQKITDELELVDDKMVISRTDYNALIAAGDIDPEQHYFVYDDENTSSLAMTPVGVVVQYKSETIMPTGWMKCDGSELQILDYQDLYNVIGNQFGHPTPDTFNLPNEEGKIIKYSPFEVSSPDYTLINDNVVSGATTYSSQKIKDIVDNYTDFIGVFSTVTDMVLYSLHLNTGDTCEVFTDANHENRSSIYEYNGAQWIYKKDLGYAESQILKCTGQNFRTFVTTNCIKPNSEYMILFDSTTTGVPTLTTSANNKQGGYAKVYTQATYKNRTIVLSLYETYTSYTCHCENDVWDYWRSERSRIQVTGTSLLDYVEKLTSVAYGEVYYLYASYTQTDMPGLNNLSESYYVDVTVDVNVKHVVATKVWAQGQTDGDMWENIYDTNGRMWLGWKQIYHSGNTDGVPTQNSTNLMTSGALYNFIGTKDLSKLNAPAASLVDAINALAIPVGLVAPVAGNAVPTGWLLCNGQAVNRTTYAKLFTTIGTIYGTGDGSTTFNVPDLRNRMPVGAGSTYAQAATGGAATVTLTTAQMPYHTHTFSGSSSTTSSNGSHSHSTSFSSTNKSGTDTATVLSYSENRFGTKTYTTTSAGSHSHTVTAYGSNSYTGSGNSHENMPPYIGMYYMIKY